MTKCKTCSYEHNPIFDGKFLVLNPESTMDGAESHRTPAQELRFCSTRCLTEFIARRENMDQIAWYDPSKLPPPDAQVIAFLAETHALPKEQRDAIWENKAMREKVVLAEATLLGHDRRRMGPGCNRCAPFNHSGYPAAVRLGPFLSIEGGERRKEFGLSGSYCGIDCCITFANEHPYDAKGWFSAPERLRCAQCNVVDYGHCDGSFIDLALVDGVASYCSSVCLLAALDAMPQEKILWKPLCDATFASLFAIADRCESCDCGANAFENDDVDIRAMLEEADRLDAERRTILDRTTVLDPSFTIVVSPTLDDPTPVNRYVETDETKTMEARAAELRKQAFALREARSPILQKPFLSMNGGYDVPVDGGAIFCSVECVRALFGNEEFCDYDAKGLHDPRPDGLGCQYEPETTVSE